MLTVFQDVSDPFYRYKMERLQAKVEGKGNGIKTVVVNLNTVAQALGRPPACKLKLLESFLAHFSSTNATQT
jgi:translation initiation factor 5